MNFFFPFLDMLAEGYNITPTNATNAIDRKGVSNRDSDILMYILIVVGASILLLLIPLISYIVQLSKRRLRRRRRRKQIEKAYGNYIIFVHSNVIFSF